MNQPVDVIIPVYNSMPFLKEAVESVLAQTYKNFRLYIVDDASEDNGLTQKYVNELKDPRIQYVRKKHEGRSAARNYGIKITSSPYVAFLDSDDSWHRDKLKKQVSLLSKGLSIGLVYGLANLINAEGNKTGELDYQKRGWLFNYLLGGNRVSGGASMVMIRREVFSKVGVFREDLSMAEDWELWLRIAREYKMDYVAEVLADIRIDLINERPKFLDKAKGLEYALKVMLNEFSLGPIGRAKLATACLSQASSLYLDSGNRSAARRTMLKMLTYNPLAFLTLSNRYRFVFVRLFFGNRLLRSVRQRVGAKDE